MTETEMTFSELSRREPALAGLLAEARAVSSKNDPDYCANAVWYGYGQYQHSGLKPRLLQLVGWRACKDDPILRSEKAYDVAYHTICNALPDCRDCGDLGE
ncbi:MAG: hypothetical protein GX113_00305 [Actinobacteria bacterium]|jgi:hypothetical protein|nr:hypothetical protein [Actinomycetota bacterium]